MKLSLCLAVYNEEKNIHYPLDSTIDLVDEVIIVDGGSTDKTVEIAKSYGKKVRVIKTYNPAMFHKNKQKAIEVARGEWILQLDADEELSKELKEEIKKIINMNQIEIKKRYSSFVIRYSENFKKLTSNNKSQITNNDVVAFYIPRKNFFLTRFLMKGGQYPDYTIRLYRNGYARFPCRDVHENVEIKGEAGYLKNPILHYADPDFSRYLMRWDRYTTLEAEKLAKTGFPNYSITQLLNYFFLKPFITFFSMYIRHKGFIDGFPGFVFALFSSIRFWVVYIKWWVKCQP